MGFWSDGAGARTAQTHHDGVQANEAARQSNRLEVQDRDQAFKTAMQNYKHAQAELNQWRADNRKWQLKEYDRECRLADKEGRESRYRTPDDVPDLAGEPFVPAKPVVHVPVREPVKVPMGVGGFVLMVAAILIIWPMISHFVVGAYIVGVFAIPAAWIAWAIIHTRKKGEAAGDPERLAALDRWNPFTIGGQVLLWCLKGCWKLFKIGIR